MNLGIEVNQIVRVKSSGQCGTVVGIDDHTDRLPADLELLMGHTDYIPSGERMKVRVDEVDPL